MTIVSVGLRPYRIAFKRPYVLASGTRVAREGFTITLEDDAGRVGLGEAAPLSGRTETLEQSERALDQALQRIDAGRRDAAAWLDRVDDLVPYGARCARSAVTTALADLSAGADKVPVSAWLSARHGWPHGPVDTVPVNATMPAGTPELAASQARQAVAAGFTTLKLKVGARDDDVERVSAVRDVAGPDVAVRLDANEAWTRDEAADRIDMLAPYDIEHFEQPVAARDVEGLAWLRSRTGAAIAADEPIVSVEAAEQVLALEAADALVVKPMVLGGPDVAMRIAARAAEAGVAVIVTSTIDAVVGRAMATHVAAALGIDDRACGLATGGLLVGDIGHATMRISDGFVRLSGAPGLGAELSTEAAAP